MDVGLFLEFPCREGMTDGEAFAECFALVDAAEALGVNSVWLAEYHFAPISVLSSPITVASAIAARTQRIRIGLAVVLLPLAHPIHIAEDIATLDHISQGRVEFGVGRGTFPDTHDGFNSPFAESRERFDEYLDIIVKAWTQERFSYAGKHYRCDKLWVRPKPGQRSHPRAPPPPADPHRYHFGSHVSARRTPRVSHHHQPIQGVCPLRAGAVHPAVPGGLAQGGPCKRSSGGAQGAALCGQDGRAGLHRAAGEDDSGRPNARPAGGGRAVP